MEAVLPAHAPPSRAAEQECDSEAAAPSALRVTPGGEAAARRVTRQAQRHQLAVRLAPPHPQVVLRMTVFGAGKWGPGDPDALESRIRI